MVQDVDSRESCACTGTGVYVNSPYFLLVFLWTVLNNHLLINKKPNCYQQKIASSQKYTGFIACIHVLIWSMFLKLFQNKQFSSYLLHMRWRAGSNINQVIHFSPFSETQDFCLTKDILKHWCDWWYWSSDAQSDFIINHWFLGIQSRKAHYRSKTLFF